MSGCREGEEHWTWSCSGGQAVILASRKERDCRAGRLEGGWKCNESRRGVKLHLSADRLAGRWAGNAAVVPREERGCWAGQAVGGRQAAAPGGLEQGC